MATRSRTTFQKRQKEMARAEKQRDKAAKRAQKKDQEKSGPGDHARRGRAAAFVNGTD